MSKFITAAAAASLLMFGATTLVAQQKDGNVAVDKKSETSDTKSPAKEADGVGTRAIGATKDEKPTDPTAPKQGEIKKLDKEGRGGQQN